MPDTPALSIDGLVAEVNGRAPSRAPLELLSTAVLTIATVNDVADAVLSHFVDRCRKAGHSWTEIGGALGVTKQAAQQRFSATMLFGRFSERAREAVTHAQEEARGLGHHYLGSEHLLLGLFGAPDGLAARVLGQLGVSKEYVRAEVERRFPKNDATPKAAIPFTPKAKATLERAGSEADALGQHEIATEHLMLALLSGDEPGVAADILRPLNVDHTKVGATILSHRSKGS